MRTMFDQHLTYETRIQHPRGCLHLQTVPRSSEEVGSFATESLSFYRFFSIDSYVASVKKERLFS